MSVRLIFNISVKQHSQKAYISNNLDQLINYLIDYKIIKVKYIIGWLISITYLVKVSLTNKLVAGKGWKRHWPTRDLFIVDLNMQLY
ncbi:hypothetical protein C3B55_00058 [Candidatus Pseudomonas adelgestsugas]|uniref:Uncharacterized protein n=1 Tax=Candidatus Pseudomonas adelgestsugas TaxID=1302376 RepID=A0ABX5R7X2_9PSED|nr:hypothetical protein C3B55_00058 [Candidatus Pseudomonas adelgestsugas]